MKLTRDQAPGRVQHDHASRSPSPTASRRALARQQEASGRCGRLEPRERRTSIPPGSRSCSMRRSTSRRLGRRCTRSCATARAMSCSTIWGSTKTRWGSSFARIAPTSPISCAPISPSRWACPTATRSARAAAAAKGRSCPAWWNIQNEEPPPHAATGRDGRGRDAAACAQRSVRVLRPACPRRPEPGDPHWHRRTDLGRFQARRRSPRLDLHHGRRAWCRRSGII